MRISYAHQALWHVVPNVDGRSQEKKLRIGDNRHNRASYRQSSLGMAVCRLVGVSAVISKLRHFSRAVPKLKKMKSA